MFLHLAVKTSLDMLNTIPSTSFLINEYLELSELDEILYLGSRDMYL